MCVILQLFLVTCKDFHCNNDEILTFDPFTGYCIGTWKRSSPAATLKCLRARAQYALARTRIDTSGI